MRKHTPGPWRLRRAEHSLEHDFILHAGPHIIAWSVPRADRRNARKKSEHIANAKLIAAAPVLLEALRIAREHIQIDRNSFKEAHSFPDGFMEREDQAILKRLDQKLAVIDAAIAKAEAP